MTGEMVTARSGNIKDQYGNPEGTFTCTEDHKQITVNAEITYTAYWYPSGIGGDGSYYDSAYPSSAHTRIVFRCMQSNMDGCFKWLYEAFNRDNSSEPWVFSSAGTFEKS